MEGISHYEGKIAEVVSKIRYHEPLTLDNKIDFYLDCHRIKLREAEVEIDPNRKSLYLSLAKEYLENVIRLEKRLNLKVKE